MSTAGALSVLYRRGSTNLRSGGPGRRPGHLSASAADTGFACVRAGGTCPGSALDEIDRLRNARRFADQNTSFNTLAKVFSIRAHPVVSKASGKKADGSGLRRRGREVLTEMWEGGDRGGAAAACLKAVRPLPQPRRWLGIEETAEREAESGSIPGWSHQASRAEQGPAARRGRVRIALNIHRLGLNLRRSESRRLSGASLRRSMICGKP